jgi:predicted HicB family RNase H-like nuclease
MSNEKTTSLNLREFPDELHRQAKVKAAMMRISLKEFIIRAVTEYLKKTDGGQKKGGL